MSESAFVQHVLEEIAADPTPARNAASKLSASPVGVLIGGCSDVEARAVALAILEVLSQEYRPRRYLGEPVESWADLCDRLDAVLVELARRDLSWTAADARRALTLEPMARGAYAGLAPLRFALSVANRAAELHGVTGFEEQVEELRADVAKSQYLLSTERTALLLRIAAVQNQGGLVTEHDAWGRSVRRYLKGLPPGSVRPALMHFAGAGTRPSSKWFRSNQGLSEAPEFASLVRTLVEEIPKHEQASRTVMSMGITYVVAELLDAPNTEIARGAIWAASQSGADWVVPSLREVASFCGTTPGGGGVARSEKLTNAAVGSLGAVGTNDAVMALSFLKTRIKNRAIRKGIDRVLVQSAAQQGLSASELLERCVPTLGLDEDGTRREQVGDHVAVLRLGRSGLDVSWSDGVGKPLKSVPSAIKANHPAVSNELRALVKESQKVVSAERARLESLFHQEREWDFPEWHQLYVSHSVTGPVSRGLLWTFEDKHESTTLLVTEDGTLCDELGRAASPAEHAKVRMWHPIRSTPDTTGHWRSVLVERQLAQPFKQAFREVYRITPAELETGIYSNRFAGHILHYRQVNALLRTRGWNARSLGYWDGGFEGEAIKEFPDHGIRALFSYDLVEQAAEARSSSPSLCSTDRVRFERLGGRTWQVVGLQHVPDVIFSEAMRDVDLFVGVSSIAGDPDWVDRGPDRRFDGYWREYSFGELNETAQTRRQALERLIPRTKISDRCSITERYLVVRGDLRTYKIHLGSGNILMEPDDTYLCIVPSRRTDLVDKLFLPFEEDGGRLSLIVSKALLLAEDKKIKDPTIRFQIRGA